MKKYILSIVLVLIANNVVNAQCVGSDLLRNGNFESNSCCPVSLNPNSTPGALIPCANDWLQTNEG